MYYLRAKNGHCYWPAGYTGLVWSTVKVSRILAGRFQGQLLLPSYVQRGVKERQVGIEIVAVEESMV